MLTHLLQHAARFSPAGSVVTLTVAEAGERVRMTVGDDGPSVDPAEREALFDLLAQARLRRERKRYANGLGLVYCRMAAEAQGGSVRLADGDRYAVVVELPVGG